MNFNSVRGGIRRHAPFEEKLTEIFSKDILETPFPGINIKHLRIRNETKQNKTKLVHHFDFGQPKQNKIMIFKILFDQN